jgi:diazepam-binding inhibitor (GABA receptor modulator, acyl-CoA-binding protein)
MSDFEAAVAYVRSLPKGESTLTQEQQLAFYANFKQATVGPCKQHGGAQPWAVQFEARAKWDAWNALGDKTVEAAKADYVKMLDEAVSAWRK